jgi:hypothetical protein
MESTLNLLRLKKICILVVSAVVLTANHTNAEKFTARHVETVDGIVKCNWARDRLITVISGPCDNFVPPNTIKIGEPFQANGRTKTINVIFADHIEKNMPSMGLKAGDWVCTAAESETDIPSASGDSHTGTWLYIAKCKPLE